MEETPVDLRQMFQLLQRQKRLIIATVVSVMLIAGLVIFSLAPVYTASALILVDPSRKDLLAGDVQSAGGSSDNARIDSEVEILRSDNILLKVIDAENLLGNASTISLSLTDSFLNFFRLQEPQLLTPAQALSHALTGLRDAVSVQRRGLTYLISVQARSGDPARAAVLANAVANAYIADQLAAKVDSSLASRDLLQERIVQAREAIVRSEGSFDGFIEQNIQQLAGGPAGLEVAGIRDQIDQLAEARNRSAELLSTARFNLAQNDIAALVNSLGSSALFELERQRDDLLARLAGPESASSPVVDLNLALKEVNEQLLETAKSQVGSLQSTVSQFQNQQDALRGQLRSAVLSSSLSADTLTQLYGLQQNAELARQQYQVLLSRVHDLETQAQLQIADSRIVSPALVPIVPTFPNKLLLLIASAIGATGLGIGFAFLYDSLIGGFTSESQLASVLRVQSAVAVPRVKAKSETSSVADLMTTAPLSAFPESIRRLRVAVEQSMRIPREAAESDEGKVIVISSASPNEGKTTIALGLARAYALSGHRTLLIDCDLREPRLHQQLGIEPRRGLLDFLSNADAHDLSDVVSVDAASPLTCIVGARRSEVPTDQLLASPSFARLIHAARNTFDFVVIDTPPVGPVVDSMYVMPFADAVVLVARWAATAQNEAKRALSDINKSKPGDVDIVGVVNLQDQTRNSRDRRYFGYDPVGALPSTASVLRQSYPRRRDGARQWADMFKRT